MAQTDFPHGFNDPDYKTDDPPTYSQACMGMLVCPHCGKAVMCGDVASNTTIATTGEDDNMIPRGSINDNGRTNSSGGRKGKRTGLRYISADMLSTAHQLATIEDARTQPDNFKPNGPDVVVVKLKFKGEFLLWTLRVNNPSLAELGDSLGDDETKWSGTDIELFIEEDNFDGKKWIRVQVAGESKSTEKTKRGK